jgi:pentatricopeptide repeat protein
MKFYIPDGRRPSRFYRGVHPNARTLACIIDAWANAKTSTSFAPERADAILHMAIERRRSYVDHAMGRARVQSEVADVDSPGGLEEEGVAFADGEHIDEETVEGELCPTGMASISSSQLGEIPISQSIEGGHPPLKPNTVAFNTCLHAWAASDRGREGALRAQELLFLLEALSDSGELDLPDDDHFDVEGDDDTQDTGLTPNVRTYSMVMNAWANAANVERGSGEDAASRCEEILNKMERRGALDSSVRPNLVAYVTSITCWARTRNVVYAASRAENILNRMIDLYYNEDKSELPILDGDLENASHDAPFNSVITCYARSSDPYATERALAVLERLLASPIRPTVTTFNAVMDVCAKHGDPVSALAVFDRMKTMNIRGDSTSVDTILNAFGRCDKAGSAEQAYDFLRKAGQSENINFTPSSVSYSTVINAFARASGKDYGGLPAVKKAEEIYESLIDQIKNGVICGASDPFANSCLLNCCANIYGSRAEKKDALVIAVSDVHMSFSYMFLSLMMILLDPD